MSLRKGVEAQAISRNVEDFTRQRRQDIKKVFHNVDPVLHPMERAREYTRALNAAKRERMFSQPFLFALDGHSDGIFSMSTVPTSLVLLASGACDGEIRMWHLGSKRTLWAARAHSGFVRGLSCSSDGELLVSCSNDNTVKLWRVALRSDGAATEQDEAQGGVALGDEQKLVQGDDDAAPDAWSAREAGRVALPVSTLLWTAPFTGVDFQRQSHTFATSGAQLDLWDTARSEPLHSFAWGADSITTVKFNPIETHVLASCASDRNVVLYDVRAKTPLRKMLLRNLSNAVSWNPMEAFNFTLANEDNNCYTYDMRRLDSALCIHKDHLGPVLSVDYSPTGREFATGSYDQSVRIFANSAGRSREVYHAKRMQKVFVVRYSRDARYIVSGSDDFNLRVWKATAWDRLKPMNPRQRAKHEYDEKLKERFRHAPEIRRILRHRHLPALLHRKRQQRHEESSAEKERFDRRVRHSKPGSVEMVPERRKVTVKQVE